MDNQQEVYFIRLVRKDGKKFVYEYRDKGDAETWYYRYESESDSWASIQLYAATPLRQKQIT